MEAVPVDHQHDVGFHRRAFDLHQLAHHHVAVQVEVGHGVGGILGHSLQQRFGEGEQVHLRGLGLGLGHDPGGLGGRIQRNEGGLGDVAIILQPIEPPLDQAQILELDPGLDAIGHQPGQAVGLELESVVERRIEAPEREGVGGASEHDRKGQDRVHQLLADVEVVPEFHGPPLKRCPVASGPLNLELNIATGE